MTTVVDEREDAVVLARAPVVVRAIGAWMCVIALFGFIVVPLSGGAFYVIGPLWGLAGLTYGLRVVRTSAIESPEGLIVRNRFRSYKIAWDDILSVDFEKRPVPITMRMGFMSDRRAGRVRRESGADFWLDATETAKAFPYGYAFSLTPTLARARTEAVANAWRMHTGPQGQ